MNKNLICFLVITRGTWGRGATVADAAKKCVEAGAGKRDECSLRYVVGDDKPSYDGMYISYSTNQVETKLIGIGFTIGSLLKVRAD